MPKFIEFIEIPSNVTEGFEELSEINADIVKWILIKVK